MNLRGGIELRKRPGEGYIAFIGNYLPRQCGIATFTTDLCEAVAEEAAGADCIAVAMNDVPEGYPYPDRVRFEVAQNSVNEYRNTADFLNVNQVQGTCVQHEYGIFGGRAGSHLLALLRELRMPIVTTLHTVLRDPNDDQRRVVEELARLSDRLVVMSQQAMEFLTGIHKIPESKITMIHHGVPDVSFVDPSYYKDLFGVEGHRVILTFGLLSPSKGIEYMIDALPAVVRKHPDVVYMVLGATHPHILRAQGEEYRMMLQRRAHERGVRENVIFQNRFVDLAELTEFLGAADIYVTPYLNETQIVSGTLAYALGAGKAVISTPYWYATELLAEGRGTIVPFRDPEALASSVIDWLDNEAERHAARKRAYLYGRSMIWKEVARQYLEVFEDVHKKRQFHRRPLPVGRVDHRDRDEVPELDLRHLRRLTDDTGLLQHAAYSVPMRSHGYCTDDVARGLIVAVKGSDWLHEEPEALGGLLTVYLSFLEHAFDTGTRRFRNFMSYQRQWIDEVPSEDTHGRALWGLGIAAASLSEPGQSSISARLFKGGLATVLGFDGLRCQAFTLLGLDAYLRRFGGDSEARRIRERLAERLLDAFTRRTTDTWPWPEEQVTYASGKLPHALLLTGRALGRDEMTERGLEVLEFLMDNQRATEGHFSPIGQEGWLSKDGQRARFDQQPLEAHAMIEACLAAWEVTGEDRWYREARLCFDWFLGSNDLQVPLFDSATGGCCDGLTSVGRNQNEGAESTVAWLLAVIAMQEARVRHTMETPPGDRSAVSVTSEAQPDPVP
jgi:glycosyltransferase involved in cell wall biosynthesis